MPRSRTGRRSRWPAPVDVVLSVMASLLFLTGALCTYPVPRATAPCYIGGSLLMLTSTLVGARPRSRFGRSSLTVDGSTMLVIAVGAIVVSLAFVVGERLRLGF